MLPTSWTEEIEKTVDQSVSRNSEAVREGISRQNASSDQIAKHIDTFAGHFRDYKEQQNTDDRKERRLNLITIGLVFLTVLFTGGSWWEFKGQLDEMKSASVQTNKIIEANAKLVDAATKQAEAATENAKIARDNFVASERAWVGPRNAKTSSAPTSDKDLPIMLEYGNTGREPAVETVEDTDVFAAADEENGDAIQRISNFIGKCKIMWKPDEAAVVYPSVGLSAANYTFTRIMDKSLIDDGVIGGKKTIYFTGCFSYKTTETIHRSWFCYFYRAGKTDNANWNICQTGNGAD